LQPSKPMTYKAAGQVARKAAKLLTICNYLHGDQTEATVSYPLGWEQRRVLTYKVIKLSAFLFQTPAQQSAFVNALAKFTESYSCGLEVLALRRSGEGRRRGSIADIAALIYRLIREGDMNPTKALHLTRTCEALDAVRGGHHLEVQADKD